MSSDNKKARVAGLMVSSRYPAPSLLADPVEHDAIESAAKSRQIHFADFRIGLAPFGDLRLRGFDGLLTACSAAIRAPLEVSAGDDGEGEDAADYIAIEEEADHF